MLITQSPRSAAMRIRPQVAWSRRVPLQAGIAVVLCCSQPSRVAYARPAFRYLMCLPMVTCVLRDTWARPRLEDLAPRRAEIDAHRPHAQPLVRGHPLGLLAVGNHRPGPVGEVSQHKPAGLAGVRLNHRAGYAVVAVPVEVMADQHGAFRQHEQAPLELE